MDDWIIGRRFGRLVVEEFHRRNSSSESFFICRCDCGNRKSVMRKYLVNGSAKSCGCMRDEWTKNKRLPLNEYIDSKISMLTDEFWLHLTDEELKHFRELKTESDVDRYAHKIIINKL